MTAIQTREKPQQIVRGHVGLRRRPVDPPTSQAASAGGGTTARDIVRIVRKRKWYIIISVVVLGTSAFVTTLLWRQLAPQYTAQAEIQINPFAARQTGLGAQRQEFSDQVSGAMRFQHARAIRQHEFLLAACESDEIKETAWYRDNPETVIDRLKGSLTAGVVPETNVVYVQLTSVAPSPKDREGLAELLRLLIGEYVSHIRDRENQGTTDKIKELQARRGEIEEKIEGIRRQVRENELSDVGTIAQLVRGIGVNMDALDQTLLSVDLRMSVVKKNVETLEKEIKDKKYREIPQVSQRVELDRKLQGLEEQRILIKSALDLARLSYGPEHTRVTSLENSLTAVDNRIEQYRANIEVVLAGQVLADTQMQLDGLTAQRIDLLTKKDRAGKTIKDLQENLKDVQDLRTKEAMNMGYIQRIEEALMQLRMQAGSGSVWIRSVPRVPEEISKPTWGVMLPAGILGGLVLGLGLAFALELLDTSVKGPGDLARRLDLPVLGMIPHADDLEEDFEHMPLAFEEHPNSPVCEAHRQIRTTLLFSGPSSQQRSLLVCSPMPGDGRTTLTVNLAHAIADSGRRVLVVDANFRQPAIHRLFPECPEEGLSSVLVGQVDWRDVVVEVAPNLSVIPAGPLPPNPAELLGSEQMLSTLAEMREVYDQVLLDGAPCVVVTDSVALSTLVDGVILVVRAGTTSVGVVQRTRDIFARVGAHVFGVVLNAVRVEAGGYLRRNYDTFYEYRERIQLPAVAEDEEVLEQDGHEPEPEDQEA